MDHFNDERALAEIANAMRDQFGPRAIEMAEAQAQAATTARTRSVWQRIALKLRRWDSAQPE